MSTLPRHLRGRQAGLSLIELMISITIGLIILAGVAYVFANTSEARRELERTSRQLENGRFAIDLLSDDLRLAGFVGELDVKSLSEFTVPSTPVPLALPDPCSVDADDWNKAIHLHLQGYYTGIGAPAACLPAGLNILAGTDILVVRRARTCFAGSTGCGTVTSGTPYIQVALCSDLPTITHSIGLEGTATFALKKKDCTAAADKRQYYVHIYYVSTDNGSGANVPTLKRLTFTPGSAATATSPANFTVDPLVEGIEQFHVEYGLDTNGDGAPDVYVNDPNADAAGSCTAPLSPVCQVANWMNVVTAHVYVVSRGLETTPGYVDAKTYQLGTLPFMPAPGVAAYRRHAYSALVRITNPAGRRDTP